MAMSYKTQGAAALLVKDDVGQEQRLRGNARGDELARRFWELLATDRNSREFLDRFYAFDSLLTRAMEQDE